MTVHSPNSGKKPKGSDVPQDPLSQALYASYSRSGNVLHYWAGYFLRELKRKGGLTVAKSILAKKEKRGITKGLSALIKAGKPELSVEWIARSPSFRHMFTADEIRTAEDRLRKNFGIASFEDQAQVVLYLGEVLDWQGRTEGALTRVLTNRFERDARAHDACLKKHGVRCKVCEFQFEERYGELGKDFIHVHHTVPLSAIRKTYRVNPEKDLVPVCRNCHAMLHRGEKLLSVDDLRRLLVSRRDRSEPT